MQSNPTNPHQSDAVEVTLKPCPFCGSDQHLTLVAVGSMTGDMPARPYAMRCHHIDHDYIQGPTAYGKREALTAWNTRTKVKEDGDGD